MEDKPPYIRFGRLSCRLLINGFRVRVPGESPTNYGSRSPLGDDIRVPGESPGLDNGWLQGPL